MLRKEKENDIEVAIEIAANRQRATFHRTLKTSPIELVFGVNKFDCLRVLNKKPLQGKALENIEMESQKI